MQTLRDAIVKACREKVEQEQLLVSSETGTTTVPVIRPKTRKTRTRSTNSGSVIVVKRPLSWMIGEDLIRCARNRNNILTQILYKAEGKYTIEQVTEAYGSFAAACMEHNIVNPDNLDDYDRIAEDVKHVAALYHGKITPEIYKDEGIFSYEGIDRKYGFYDILVKEGLAPRTILYPVYPVKKRPRHARLFWSYTYDKVFRGV